jgi:GT2 family glycosyltransferase
MNLFDINVKFMISIVIPTYNRKESLLRLLNDLGAQSSTNLEVIVVDDCSTDESVASVRKFFPSVRLLINDRNVGPAASRNRGILVANGSVIVGLDSDVSVPDHQFFSNVEHIFRNRKGRFGLAFRILLQDGISDDVERWWHPFTIDTHVDIEFETSYFSGTAYAFPRQALLEAGLYREIFYMHFEEVELAWRIMESGTVIYYCPDLSVVHNPGRVSRRSEVDCFFRPRNQVLLALSCLPFPHVVVFLLPRLLVQLIRSLSGEYFHKYLSAMLSAAYLAPRLVSIRQPLKYQTLRTIHLLVFPKSLSARFYRRAID